jgi:hypothetical protein
MAQCDTTDFMFPLLADIYYPIVSQSAYGDVSKKWVLDRSVAIQVGKQRTKGRSQIPTGVELLQDSILIGRARVDLRYGSQGDSHPMTDVLITNIRTAMGDPVYNETSGPRNGRTTLFELKTTEPTVGPFGEVEFFSLVIKRSENQGVDV